MSAVQHDETAEPTRAPARDLLVAAFRAGGGVRRLVSDAATVWVRGNDTFVPVDDALAPAIAAWVGSAGSPRYRELRRLAAELAARLAGTLSSEAAESVPEDAVGPLPTSALVMASAGLGAPDELLAWLGGPETRYRAAADRRRILQLPGLDAEGMFLLSRFDPPQRVVDVLQQGAMERHTTLALLCRLRAVGLLERAEAPGGAAPEAADEEVLQRFADRIGRELAEEPLELAPGLHRAELTDLLATHGGKDHYELLEVEPTATTEEIHGAYEKLARRIHPSHARRLELGSPAALELLFERATVAYRVLTDPARRSAYNLELGIHLAEHRSAAERREEQQRLARQDYEQAVRYAEAEQYHFAVELLRQALRLDARAEYHALLGSCLARNPNWLHEAIASYQRAMQLEPRDGGHAFALAQLHEKQGDVEAARQLYEQTLERVPGHPDAAAALERLDAEAVPGRKSKKRGKKR